MDAIFAPLATAAVVSASSATLEPTIPRCTDFISPVTASAPVKFIDQTTLPTNFGNPTVSVNFVLKEASTGLAALLALPGTHVVTRTYQMSARYCEPVTYNAFRADTIQYLEHGATTDKNYWNGLNYPIGIDAPSCVMELTNLWYGYPTIAIDRLGNGNSSHPDPITTVQMSLQVATIHKIITELRQGTIKGPSKNRSFKKVIFTAHSYGSICGNAIASEYPKDVDAFVLTGYTGDFEGAPGPFSVGIPQPAATAMPARYAGYALGYLVQTLLTGRNFSLHTTPRYGDFDRAVAEYDFDNEGTISVGELATLFYGLGQVDAYTGPVYVVTGQRDHVACSTPVNPHCGKGVSPMPAVAGKFFSNAKDYSYHIPAATGHNVNLLYSAPQTFQLIHQYLASQGF